MDQGTSPSKSLKRQPEPIDPSMLDKVIAKLESESEAFYTPEECLSSDSTFTDCVNSPEILQTKESPTKSKENHEKTVQQAEENIAKTEEEVVKTQEIPEEDEKSEKEKHPIVEEAEKSSESLTEVIDSNSTGVTETISSENTKENCPSLGKTVNEPLKLQENDSNTETNPLIDSNN